ncbi:hypothetical protein FBG83_08260 [Campylobacter coli]|nr:hypothetical protein [Campylobacter coli]EAH4978956.1 hypothetical protein [Campylobacter coli]EAH8946651.1 hypothetical protein [Campylobacter coli]EAI0601579.1 hypothetical protein [Campylobacter coli]EAI5712684.1 hypothetical protein [Campylobacter coli]
MQKQYPEVHSLEESLAILKKYKMIHACVEASQLKPGRLEALIKDNLKNFRQNLDLEQNKGMSL